MCPRVTVPAALPGQGQRCPCAQELHHQHPPPFQVPAMAGVPGPAGHAMLEVSPALIGSVVWQSNLIEEN